MHIILYIILIAISYVCSQQHYTHYIDGKWYSCDESIKDKDKEIYKDRYGNITITTKGHYFYISNFYDKNNKLRYFRQSNTVVSIDTDIHSREYIFKSGSINSDNDTIYDEFSVSFKYTYKDSMLIKSDEKYFNPVRNVSITFKSVQCDLFKDCIKRIGSDSSIVILDSLKRIVYHRQASVFNSNDTTETFISYNTKYDQYEKTFDAKTGLILDSLIIYKNKDTIIKEFHNILDDSHLIEHYKNNNLVLKIYDSKLAYNKEVFHYNTFNDTIFHSLESRFAGFEGISKSSTYYYYKNQKLSREIYKNADGDTTYEIIYFYPNKSTQLACDIKKFNFLKGEPEE